MTKTYNDNSVTASVLSPLVPSTILSPTSIDNFVSPTQKYRNSLCTHSYRREHHANESQQCPRLQLPSARLISIHNIATANTQYSSALLPRPSALCISISIVAVIVTVDICQQHRRSIVNICPVNISVAAFRFENTIQIAFFDHHGLNY